LIAFLLAATTVSPVLIVIAAIVLAVVILVVVLPKSMYKVAEPNEALIISGFGAHRPNQSTAEETDSEKGFKIVVGKGVFVLPLVQRVRRLSLDIHEAELDVVCVTKQAIKLHVKAVVIYKIADDFGSIANAARRFLEQEDQMDAKVHNVFAGHLRSIIGTLTVEEIIRERDKLTQATRESSSTEMGKLGLTIDSLQIQEIDDEEGEYIANLSKPEAARVASEARIAQASSDREATQREQEANALKAAAESESAIKQAEAQANADKARAQAAQAGPLAEATARQQVIEQETEAAKLEAQRVEQQLEAQVRRPADAKAYETRTIAEGERDATIARAEADKQKTQLGADASAYETEKNGAAKAKATQLTGEADGAAKKAVLVAEADGIKARAEALAANQDAVIGQQIAEKMPEIVAAAASAFGSIDNLMVMNGAEGMGDMFKSIMGLGAGAAPMLRQLIEATKGADKPGAIATHKENEA
jgi:flotillin